MVKQTKQLTEQQRALAATYFTDAQKIAASFYRKYKNVCDSKNIILDDLIDEAITEMIRCVEKYDSAKGKFGNYISTCITYRLRNYTKGKGMDDNIDDHHDIANDIADEQEDRVARVYSLLNILPEKRRKIVCMKFGIDTPEMKIKDIAIKMKISEGRIRQILQTSLTEMEFSNVA